MLEPEGYALIKSLTGEKTLDLVKQYRPDLLITDIVMPDKEGLETIQHVRARYPLLPILAISGFDETYLEIAKDLGANDSLSKPIEKSLLLKKVASLLE